MTLYKIRQWEKIMAIVKAKVEDANGLADIAVKAWQYAYKGIIDQNYLDNMSIEKAVKSFRETVSNKDNKQIRIVYKSEDKVIGFAFGGLYNNKANLKGFYILPENHGEGIGKQLFIRFIEEVIKKGVNKMEVGVLSDNKLSKGIYVHFGGKLIRNRDFVRNDKIYKEDVYLYNDLKNILKKLKE